MKDVLQKLTGFASIGLIVVTFQSCTDGKGATHTIPKASEAIPVRVIDLAPSSGHTVIKASGQLTTNDETVLGFKAGGVVSRVYLREGDAVRKGQVLATLDLTEINAGVAQARMNAEKAERDYKRAANLYADSVVTLEQFQNTETALAVATRQLEAAEFNRSYSEIHAPADGFVLKKFVNAGQVVSTGDPVLLVNAVSKQGWVLKVGVSDRQWSQLQLSNDASIRIDAFPDQVFKGKITRKAETADPASGAFTIELSVDASGKKLATGMFGAAEFTSREAQAGWSVPFEAVLDAHDREGFVFVTNDGQTAHRQPVVIESFDGQHIIVSDGLKTGQQLIVSGSAYLTDSSLIRVIK
jgi:RND family efflux transporter MFP subunit